MSYATDASQYWLFIAVVIGCVLCMAFSIGYAIKRAYIAGVKWALNPDMQMDTWSKIACQEFEEETGFFLTKSATHDFLAYMPKKDLTTCKLCGEPKSHPSHDYRNRIDAAFDHAFVDHNSGLVENKYFGSICLCGHMKSQHVEGDKRCTSGRCYCSFFTDSGKAIQP